MFKFPDLATLIDQLMIWFSAHIWTISFLVEGIIIVASFGLGTVFYKLVKEPATEAIENSTLPLKIKRNLFNMKRLILPIAALVVMFIGAMIASAEVFTVDTSFLEAVMKVLVAWIGIRAAVQFIENSLVRNIFAITIWTVVALSIFGILDQTTDTLDAFGFSIGNFRLSLLAVIKGVLSLFLLIYAAQFLSSFVERRVLRSRSLTRSSQVLIAKIIRITLLVFAVLIGITSAGIDLSVFTVFSGAVGLGLGFGLQKVASNLFSGLLLLMDKSITPGDVIELENSGTFGWVNHMGARYTEIITRDNKSYLIPNEEFVTQSVVNWSHGNKLIRLSAAFGVHYNSDPHQVIKVVKEAATRPERVVEDPEPQCWIEEFGDSSINFTLRFWIKDAEGGVTNVKGEVLLAIWDAFQENDIQIPYPHREVFVHKVEDLTTQSSKKAS
ncbi:MAG: mechanosensitive ion channel domain-containing protein [Pseudomonadota bacterium]